MAVKKKRNNNLKKNNKENYFSFSSDKIKKIFGILLILFSIFLFFSIISYDRRDEANLTGFFSTSELGTDIHNWAGIFGAYTSNFFINSTIGYFSIVFPFLFFTFGISFFKKITTRILIHGTNFLLLSGIIIASLLGVFRMQYNVFAGSYELSGLVGDYLGGLLSNLFGGVISILLLITAMIALLIFAFDIKIEKIFLLIKKLFQSLRSKENTKLSTESIEEDNINLIKIKKLRSDKKKKGTEITAEDLMTEEEVQTNIRIIRKDDQPSLPVKNKLLEDQKKKVDLEKTGEIHKKDVDRTAEEKLPDPWEENINYKMVGLDLLDAAPEENFQVAEEELKRNAELLKEKLKLFDIDIEDISVTPGPVVTLYEIVPAPGVKISKIVSLENDIALALAARGIRIIAPIRCDWCGNSKC